MKTRKRERGPEQRRTRESEEVTFGDQRLFAVTFSHLCSSLMPEQCALAHLSLLTSLLPSLLRHLLLPCCGWLVLSLSLLSPKKQFLSIHIQSFCTAVLHYCQPILLNCCCSTVKHRVMRPNEKGFFVFVQQFNNQCNQQPTTAGINYCRNTNIGKYGSEFISRSRIN